MFSICLCFGGYDLDLGVEGLARVTVKGMPPGLESRAELAPQPVLGALEAILVRQCLATRAAYVCWALTRPQVLCTVGQHLIFMAA